MNMKRFPINVLVMIGFILLLCKSPHFDMTHSGVLGALEFVEVFLFQLDQEID